MDRSDIRELLNGVFLNQDPAIATLLESLDELIADIRVVGQSHFGRGESPDSAKCLETKDCGKEMLPGPDMQAVVLNRCRGSYRMSPGHTKPLDTTPVVWVASDSTETVNHVIQAHLAQAVEQTTRIIEHHTRLFSILHKLRDELSHSLVAPMKYPGVMVVTDVWVVQHILEVADDMGSP